MKILKINYFYFINIKLDHILLIFKNILEELNFLFYFFSRQNIENTLIETDSSFEIRLR
jgi:hypothetical protein